MRDWDQPRPKGPLPSPLGGDTLSRTAGEGRPARDTLPPLFVPPPPRADPLNAWGQLQVHLSGAPWGGTWIIARPDTIGGLLDLIACWRRLRRLVRAARAHAEQNAEAARHGW